MMYDRMKNIGIKEYFSVLIVILVLTNIAILLNIPFLRQILGFIFFTIFPGILIVHILKLVEIPFLEKLVLSIGLSIAFLMFGGLFINSFYPIIPKPLSLFPLLTSFDTILLVLMFIAYRRNRYDFNIRRIFNYEFNLNGKLTSPLVFPIVFPFMAIYGTYLMNTYGNNVILVTMLLLIPIYIVTIVLLRNKIHSATYPFAILMIVMGLVLMRGLTSDYITGTDIHDEYYTFRLTLASSYWDVSNYDNVLNALLSVTILPTIYGSILDSDMYIFKLYYPLIFSVTPVCLYILFKRYTTELCAFLASIFFLSQFSLYSMVDHVRQAIAMLYFSLIIMVLFDDGLYEIHKKILMLIFALAVIVSHYATTYIFIVLMLSVCLMSILTKTQLKHSVTMTTISFLLVATFFWYGQLTDDIFGDIVKFARNTIVNMYGFFIEESIHESTLMLLGKGANRYPDIINVAIHYASFFLILLGSSKLMMSYNKDKSIKFGIEYIAMVITSVILLMISVVLPYVSRGYGIDRIYFQTLVIMSPIFIIGGETIAKFVPRVNLNPTTIVVIILIAQFFSGTYMIYQIFGIPHSIDLNKNGELGSKFYVHDQEIVSAKWLNNVGLDNYIYSDYWSKSRLKLGKLVSGSVDKPNVLNDFFKNNETMNNGFIYLRYSNMINNKISTTNMKDEKLENYGRLFINKNKIYTNDGSDIYR